MSICKSPADVKPTHLQLHRLWPVLPQPEIAPGHGRGCGLVASGRQGASHLRGHSLGDRARRGRRGGGAQAVHLNCRHERALAHPRVGLPGGFL